ncbi:MAG: 16S rRNA (guanine(527)-N(7))-methyltransferase RsmG, partial [Oscillospiraceae bacterium]|nr:16S rRNA (guanine(527)-N(7))-methyltransferase RsmG [Oscillospiraceae bacterium]
MIDKNLLIKTCADFSVEIDSEAAERFDLFAQLLIEKNKVLNLTAITEPDEVVIKHFADSLTALSMIDIPQGATVIDVGTGGGFPGIPLLIARPDIKLTMLDSTRKKLDFVGFAVEELGLSANILHARAEEAGQGELRESFDFAVSRAVAALNVLCEYCLPFVKQNGIFCAMKGSKGEEELAQAKSAISTLGGKVTDSKVLTLADGADRTLI